MEIVIHLNGNKWGHCQSEHKERQPNASLHRKNKSVYVIPQKPSEEITIPWIVHHIIPLTSSTSDTHLISGVDAEN